MKSDGVNYARPMIAFELAKLPYSNKYVNLGFCRYFERTQILIGPGKEASGERCGFCEGGRDRQ